jgi:hypothetical protein
MSARHAATDGSFGRSAGGAAARGALLLAVALVLGILLLRSGGGDPYSRSVRAVSPGSPEVSTQIPTATTVTVPLRTPADIKVLPTNGTSTAGAATNTGNRLKSAGYNVLAATNTTNQATASNVFYNPGFEREARVIAQLLGFSDATVQPMPTPPPVADTRGADVIVVVGPDQARAGAPPATSPPTTAKRTTVTTARSTPTTARTTTTKAGVTNTTKHA